MFFYPQCDPAWFPILEVGPGSAPHPYSDVWLDFLFDTKQQIQQSGNETPAEGKWKVFYKGGRFPFRDKSFPYVIASHVLEHIPIEHIPIFISELERVAHAGYIELPRWTWELIGDWDVHISSGDVKNGKLYIHPKKYRIPKPSLAQTLLQNSKKFQEYIRQDKELFVCKLEWREKLPYEILTQHPMNGDLEQMNATLQQDIQRLCQSIPQDKNPEEPFFEKIKRTIIKRNKVQQSPERKNLSKTELKELLSPPHNDYLFQNLLVYSPGLAPETLQ